MYELDDTDVSILRLLVEDARRPYSEIADRVDVSPPTVSDRVDRLQELGVVKRFTLDVDRSVVEDGVELLLTLDAEPGTGRSIADQMEQLPPVEHVFVAADDRVTVHATVPREKVRGALLDPIDGEHLQDWSVRLLSDVRWTPGVPEAGTVDECEECGAAVTDGGETLRTDGTRYQFCSTSCKDQFEADEVLADDSI